jgi:hypothetical protein
MRLPFVKNIRIVVLAGLLCVRGADALISANKLCKSLFSEVCHSPFSGISIFLYIDSYGSSLTIDRTRTFDRWCHWYTGNAVLIGQLLSRTDTDSVTYCSEAKSILVNEFDIQYHKNNHVSIFDAGTFPGNQSDPGSVLYNRA